MSKTIALLGQPNSGKSSLFNGLTGSHQHVGNWPGKTVEHKEGVFTFQGEEYHVIDLPGSYSLSAGSEEEVITTDYIASGKADLVVVLVDSSQLERSLYMFTDFIGINIPVILILNLMDVAKMKGIQIDTAKIQKKLGIPVMDFVAADIRRYVDLKEKLAEAIDSGRMAQSSLLMKYYYQDPDCHFEELTEKQQEILDFIKNEILNRGFPPSVRDICEAVHLKSTSSVHAHLETLERNGYIHRDPTKPRAIEIIDDAFNLVRREVVNVPIVGRVAAGEPILAVQNIENYFPIPAEYMPNAETYMLTVHGDSMVNVGILDGDQVLVEKRSYFFLQLLLS